MKSNIIVGLLTSTLLTSGSAMAQSSDLFKDSAKPSRHQSASKQVDGRKSARHSASTEEAIEVRGAAARSQPGGGLMKIEHSPRNIQTVSSDFIAKQSPTQNVVNLLAMMPGVTSTSQDPSGIDSSNIIVRGLGAAEQGWMLDGAPQNNSGTYQAELIDTENLETLAIAPGTSSTNDPTISAVVGTVYMKMRDPLAKTHVTADFSYGTYKLYRAFARIDTGEIGHTGVNAFLSYSFTRTNNWRGPGYQEKQHIDFKATKKLENGSTFAFEGFFNDNQSSANYLYPTAAQWRASKWINYDSTYSGVKDTNFYKLHNGDSPFYSGTALAPAHLVLTPALTFDDVPYFWWDRGWGFGGSVLTQGKTFQGSMPVSVELGQNTPAGSVAPGTPVLVNSGFSSYVLQGGNNMTVNYKTGHNTVFAGWWYERYASRSQAPVGYVDQLTGDPISYGSSAGSYKLSNGSIYYSSNNLGEYELNALYIGDRLSLFDGRLNVDFGFKDAMVSRTIHNYLPGARKLAAINENQPLPSFSARYRLNDHHEFYLNAEGDYRQADTASSVQGFSVATGSVTTGATLPKSEYAIKEELGYRYNGQHVLASVSFYNYNITNRLLSLNTFLNGATISQTVNAGGQTVRGVDAQISTTPVIFHLRPYLSFAYNHSTLDNNLSTVATNGSIDYLPTKGKTSIQSPHFSGALGISYDDGMFFGNLNLHYTGSQYSTMMNDEKMPAFITDNVTLGMRLSHIGFLERPELRVNLQNINNSTQRTGVYAFRTNAGSTRGILGGAVAGSAPTYYVEPGFSAIMTISSGF